MKNWRNQLKLLRLKSGMTGALFASIVGCTYSNLTKIESGKQNMSMDTMEKVLNYFDMTFTDFYEL